jgi:hypothetical protein
MIEDLRQRLFRKWWSSSFTTWSSAPNC